MCSADLDATQLVQVKVSQLEKGLGSQKQDRANGSQGDLYELEAEETIIRNSPTLSATSISSMSGQSRPDSSK